MEKLTNNEIELYMGLPIKIREYIATNCRTLIWVKSKYGLGYKLAIPSNSFTYSDGGISLTATNPFTYTTTGTTGTSISSYGPLGGNGMLNGTGTGYGTIQGGLVISNAGYQTKTKTKLSEDLLFGIPFNADEIIDSLAEFIVEFLYEAGEVPEAGKDLISFDFDVESEDSIPCCQIAILDYEIKESASSYRELALKLFSSAIEHLIKSYRPSITELTDIKNILKDEDDVNSILYKDIYKAKAMFDSTRYDLFIQEVDYSSKEFENSYCCGEIKFVEGIFRIYGELIAHTSINPSHYINPGISTTSNSGIATDAWNMYTPTTTGSTTNTAIATTGSSNQLVFDGGSQNALEELLQTPTTGEVKTLTDTINDIAITACNNGIISKETMERWIYKNGTIN